MTVVADEHGSAGSPPGSGCGAGSGTRGRPRFLVVVTWAYVFWSLVPVLIAVQFLLNESRSRTVWQGFFDRWYWGDPVDSVWNDPTLRNALVQSLKPATADVLIAVPIGVLLAIGLARWTGWGRGHRTSHALPTRDA